MIEKTRAETTFGVIGSDDDDVLRTGTNCKPGTTFLPIAVGDIQTAYISNLWHYMAARTGNGATQLIDVKNLKPTF